MLIITYCKLIETEEYEEMNFDADKSSISFIEGDYKSEVFFPTCSEALDFYIKIIQAFLRKDKAIDLSHYNVAYSYLDFGSLKEFIKERTEPRWRLNFCTS